MKINPQHLQDKDGNFLKSATDVALMIPIIEMASWEKCFYNGKSGRLLYIYTIHPNTQENPDRKKEQAQNAIYIFEQLPEYEKLKDIN